MTSVCTGTHVLRGCPEPPARAGHVASLQHERCHGATAPGNSAAELSPLCLSSLLDTERKVYRQKYAVGLDIPAVAPGCQGTII